MKIIATIITLLLGLACMADAQTVDLRDYWPQPPAGTQIVSQDWTNAYNPAPYRSTLRRYVLRGTVGGNPVVRLDAYLNGWLSAWELRDDGTQMLEVGTWQGSVHKVYEAGREIQWGGVMSLGGFTTRSLHVDPTLSTGVTAGYWNWGTQKITFSAFYSSFTTDGGLTFANVVKLNVFQSWCANAGCAYPTGQNVWTMDYFLAPGVGIVQIDYLTPTARRDWTLPVADTWETP